MNFLTGYKTIIIGALMLLAGCATIAYMPDPNMKYLGGLAAAQGLGMIFLRLGINSGKVDDAKLIDSIVGEMQRWAKKASKQ